MSRTITLVQNNLEKMAQMSIFMSELMESKFNGGYFNIDLYNELKKQLFSAEKSIIKAVVDTDMFKLNDIMLKEIELDKMRKKGNLNTAYDELMAEKRKLIVELYDIIRDKKTA